MIEQWISDHAWICLPVLGGLVIALCLSILFYRSCREAEVFNARNATAWTCSDFFWAGTQINRQTQTIYLREDR